MISWYLLYLLFVKWNIIKRLHMRACGMLCLDVGIN
jgi:hypothetical protein